MSSTVRNIGQVVGASLVLSPIALVGQPAFAAGSCQTTTPEATLVAPGVCEVAFTEAGDYTFTAPSGIDKLQAVVIGGGSAAWLYNGLYGGGGGDVQFFDDVDFSAPVEITVGAGGEYDGGNGDDSVLNGDVVSGGLSEGRSGNENEGFGYGVDYGAAGAGAGGDAPSSDVPGVGIAASDIAGGSDLFPATDSELDFGAGGDTVTGVDVPVDETPDIPGNGGNGRLITDDGGWLYSGDDGVSGAVYLRWSIGLAATGFDANGLALGGVAVAAGGAVIAASRRRAQRA